jgi:hypothetical protein
MQWRKTSPDDFKSDYRFYWEANMKVGCHKEVCWIVGSDCAWKWLFMQLLFNNCGKCLFVVSLGSNTNSSYHKNFCVFNTECSVLWCSCILWKWMISFVKTLCSQYSVSYWDIRWDKLWMCSAYHQSLSWYKDRWAEDDEYWFFIYCNWLKENVSRCVNMYLFCLS